MRISWVFFVLIVFLADTASAGCGPRFQDILRRRPKSAFADLQWFKFNYAKQGEKPRYVDIPFVDLGAEPFRSELIPDGQRQFQPEIEEGSGFSKMVQGQALLTKLPGWFQRFLAGRSLIMRGYLLNDAKFFADMPTYFLRLGFKTQPWLVDRLAASDKLSQYILERSREMASASAQELKTGIEQDAKRPIRLFSMGGGPMVDTINTLLKLERDQPHLTKQLRENKTPIRITLADVSATGANFGKEVLARYMQPGMPLHGLDISFEYRQYDWNKPETLVDSFQNWKKDGERVLVQSEGAIGEYGSDDVLKKNLTQLATYLPDDTTFVASAFLPDAEFQKMKEERGLTEIKVFPRNTRDVQRLATQSGWTTDPSRTVNVLDQTYVFTLRRQK